ncbi:hypothetical protein ERO13_A13G167500v2 [Gossypium hirsutum]|nr:hypothetical protein ERO13_A13G167500v2 [Gossypium hirsutum]
MGSNIPKPYYFVCGSFEPKSEGEKRGFPLFPSQGHRSPIVAAPPSPNAHRGGRRARYLGGVGAWHGVAHDSEAWRVVRCLDSKLAAPISFCCWGFGLALCFVYWVERCGLGFG